MENYALSRLKSIRETNIKDPEAKIKGLYRLLCDPDLMAIAYNSIKSIPGNMTPGTDDLTLDCYSEKIVEKTISALKEQSFTFKPVRRKHIPKANSGKTRPLGVPSPRDKVVQKAMLLVLEAVYEPTFLENSHGFRKGKSCHSALKQIKTTWQGMKWAIEGDITGCYDKIDHQILIDILRKKIDDDKFIQLVWKLLRAGLVTEEGQLLASKMGTPQGGILSPLLANIYLHEFDKFLLNLQLEYASIIPRRRYPPYRKISRTIETLREKRKNSSSNDSLAKIGQEIKIAQRLQRSIPSVDPMDPNYKKVLFVRYADDWIIGVIGNKEVATEIKERINFFLNSELKLSLSTEKTKISYLPKGTTRFLGFTIKSGEKCANSTNRTLYTRKAVGWQPNIFVPMDLIVKKLSDKNFCTKLGYATRKKGWINYSDNIIITKYNVILRGLRTYYAPANNYASSINRIQYILKYSCAHTLANKHRSRIKVQLSRLTKLGLDIEQKLANKTWDFKTKVISWDGIFISYGNKRNVLSSDKCRICNSKDKLEMHHVKALRKEGVPLD
jgi:group II intron reverse transcriptase/maturase